ncbi:Nif3-like dinuclear metal center hexameric protein [Campylobacter sp. RM12647]|uniref:Nif3-like dinuclear metal center hexameric protein n=1 Tax=Campylobacter sp. RM12647 TaxID=2735737 RepID=UPI001DE22D5E|nr:Nif3-like dinuclear metal center hexameric protein [Campylobacter sp. RM12647]
MKISEVYKILDELSPFNTQEIWDNSGLILSNDDSCERIYLSLDLDFNQVKSFLSNSLIITHHPLIFKGIKSIKNDYAGNILKELIKKNCALISMHTNYDLSHLNRYFCEKFLGLEIIESDGFLAYAKNNFKDIYELADFLKAKLNLKKISISLAKEIIQTDLIGICTGSGISLASELKSNIFLTGDIKYHDALALSENNISLIDIKHYESEICFANSLASNLQKLPIEIIISSSKNPFLEY